MFDIKFLRKYPDICSQKIKQRNINIDIKNLLKLDIKNRDLIQKKEKLEQEKKILSKNKDESQFSKSKSISNEIEIIIKDQNKTQIEINNILYLIPNIALDDVPIGHNETSNKVVSTFEIKRNYNFTPAPHYVVGKNLDQMNFELSNKTSGSRFVFLKGDLALMERAISNFMLDIHTKEFAYTEISPPLIVNESTMFGTGQLPKFENDQFEIKSNDEKLRKFLIPTAEVILTNIASNEIFSIKELPLRFVASTACFRKEAGSYGKDTKGMMRQHQFYKVELVSLVEPKMCLTELDRMTNCAEEILKRLQLPFRRILLSSGDMGFSAEKTYDIEVWLPSEKKYREISSCSSCGQFQSRRMKARYKDSEKKIDYLGSLNGSGLAIGRTLVAILENYQDNDGSIIIPEVLQPYMNGKKRIIKIDTK